MACPTFLHSFNPRHPTSCARCGLPVSAHHTPRAGVQQRPGTRPRDVEFERDVTRKAAEGVADPDALIQHAETRARALSGEYVTDPTLVQTGRDRPRDVREELADARNYLVWWMQEQLDSTDARRAQIALRHVILAYQQIAG